MPYKNSEELKKRIFEQTLENIEKRGHCYVEGAYETKQSLLIIWCPQHSNERLSQTIIVLEQVALAAGKRKLAKNSPIANIRLKLFNECLKQLLKDLYVAENRVLGVKTLSI
jgi:hypothetical protein